MLSSLQCKQGPGQVEPKQVLEMRIREFHEGWSRRGLFVWGVGLLGATALVHGSQTATAEYETIHQPRSLTPDAFAKRAFEMRDLALSQGDRGYGAIVVDITSRKIVAQAPSRVVTKGDPSAHAEMEAIRDAARLLQNRDLSNYVMYSSSRPCAMCEAAAYWANLNALYYGRNATGGKAPRLCSSL